MNTTTITEFNIYTCCNLLINEFNFFVLVIRIQQKNSLILLQIIPINFITYFGLINHYNSNHFADAEHLPNDGSIY